MTVLFYFLLPILFICSPHVLSGADIEVKVDEYIEAYLSANRFSGSILVARGDEIIFSKGYGYANRELGVQNRPDMKYRLGSVTKQFTTMAFMQLYEREMLAIEDPISKYLSDYPRGDEITIHHLMSHTSGIPNFTSFPDYAETMSKHTTLEEIISRFKDEPLEFEPGSQYQYSNSGYILLGYIIEHVAGQPYEDFLQENIFDKTGMVNTGYDNNKRIIPNRASGYQFDGSTVTNASYIDMSIPHAAGALYATAEDLYRWDRALYTDVLLSEELKMKMFTPVHNNYAYGWMVSPVRERLATHHGGGINGFQTNIVRFIEDDVCIIILSNMTPAPINEITDALAAIVFDEPYEIPKERIALELPESILERYVGKYALAPDFILTVTREGNRIFTQATGQQRVEIYPASETEFFLTVVEAELYFTVEDDGTVSGLILHQGGRKMPAERIE